MARFSEGEWFLAEDGRTVYAGRAPEDAPGAFPWPGVHFVCEVGDTVEGLEGDDPVADANARMIVATRRMFEFVRRVAYEPIGEAEASPGEVLNILEAEARALLKEIDQPA